MGFTAQHNRKLLFKASWDEWSSAKNKEAQHKQVGCRVRQGGSGGDVRPGEEEDNEEDHRAAEEGQDEKDHEEEDDDKEEHDQEDRRAAGEEDDEDDHDDVFEED